MNEQAATLIADFLRGSRPAAIRAFHANLRDLEVFLGVGSAGEAIARLTAAPDAEEQVAAYRASLIASLGKVDAVNRRLVALRSILDFAHKRGAAPCIAVALATPREIPPPVPKPKTPKPDPPKADTPKLEPAKPEAAPPPKAEPAPEVPKVADPPGRTTVPDDLLCLKDAAKLVPSPHGGGRGVHQNTLKRWIFSGRLRHWKIGPYLLVRKADLMDLIKPAEKPAPPPPPVLSRTDEILKRHGLLRP